jgi:hypothetical protein
MKKPNVEPNENHETKSRIVWFAPSPDRGVKDCGQIRRRARTRQPTPSSLARRLSSREMEQRQKRVGRKEPVKARGQRSKADLIRPLLHLGPVRSRHLDTSIPSTALSSTSAQIHSSMPTRPCISVFRAIFQVTLLPCKPFLYAILPPRQSFFRATPSVRAKPSFRAAFFGANPSFRARPSSVPPLLPCAPCSMQSAPCSMQSFFHGTLPPVQTLPPIQTLPFLQSQHRQLVRQQ